jgi:hypothetical protein
VASCFAAGRAIYGALHKWQIACLVHVGTAAFGCPSPEGRLLLPAPIRREPSFPCSAPLISALSSRRKRQTQPLPRPYSRRRLSPQNASTLFKATLAFATPHWCPLGETGWSSGR